MTPEIELRIDILLSQLDEVLGIQPAKDTDMTLSAIRLGACTTEEVLQRSGLIKKYGQRARAEDALSNALAVLYGGGKVKPYMRGEDRCWRLVARRKAA
jgi:hypothetical protein